jgi:hypothetical protein
MVSIFRWYLGVSGSDLVKEWVILSEGFLSFLI